MFVTTANNLASAALQESSSSSTADGRAHSTRGRRRRNRSSVSVRGEPSSSKTSSLGNTTDDGIFNVGDNNSGVEEDEDEQEKEKGGKEQVVSSEGRDDEATTFASDIAAAGVIEENEVPHTFVARIARGLKPEPPAFLQNEAKLAAAKAATAFVAYLATKASHLRSSTSTGHRSVTAQDVFSALELAGFEDFLPQVKAEREAFKIRTKPKRRTAVTNRNGRSVAASITSSPQPSVANILCAAGAMSPVDAEGRSIPAAERAADGTAYYETTTSSPASLGSSSGLSSPPTDEEESDDDDGDVSQEGVVDSGSSNDTEADEAVSKRSSFPRPAPTMRKKHPLAYRLGALESQRPDHSIAEFK